ncbi:flagellar filament capping protein FliD [Massilia timonae]|uniref:flagellar filament capping protein FliD n=1 Tax=Massilia timonae TaxID=47229 RepID=UPI002897454F|nr:flagellar filament capping protein FliD [Massilia timonae]
MASVITAPTYDPITTATALAEKYVAARRDILTSQTRIATATERGLADLGTALSSFQASLTALTGTGKTLYTQSAKFSDTGIGSGTASASAAPGTYAFFVKQLATSSQVAFAGLKDDTGVSGELVVKMGGTEAFKINMSTADADKNGTLTPRELAAAINGAPGNASKITASVITTGTTSELVLTAKGTGSNTQITLDTAGINPPAQSSLVAANGSMRTLVAAQDAIIHVGSEGGTPITQSSNTFTNIDGVTMTFTKAQAAGSPPVSITVGQDSASTIANVQSFVDAYNKLWTALKTLTYSGDPTSGAAAGIFAADGGVRALQDRLVSLMRPVSGNTLASFGIVASKDGTLELNSERLKSQMAINPGGLDKLIGSTSATGASGIANELDKYLKVWNDAANGQITKRKSATQELQSSLTDREALIDQQYNAAYQRYLGQFTQLQSMQNIMNSNVSLFDALFGNDND